MLGFTHTRTIDAPPERVFAVFSDFARMPEYIEQVERIELLTPGEVGVGARFRETRIMFGREASEEMEVTEWDPPRRFALVAESHGARYTSRFGFAPEGAATRLEYTFEVTPRRASARVLAPFGRVMMRSMRREIEKDFDALEAAVKGNTPHEPAPQA